MASNHASLYKIKGSDAQEKRRKELLSNQQSKRDEVLDKHRNRISTHLEPVKHAKRTRRRHYEIADMLMLSEWLLQVPDDCSSWLFMICPEGRRCLVVAQKGMTIAVAKNGKELGKWETPLPGGNSSYPGVTTILDCIYSVAKECYYVLDVLHWADLPLVGTEMSCRQFWIRSRLKDELPELCDLRRPIIPLETYSCTRDTIEDVLNTFPYFQSNLPKVDGVLFYHQDAHYTQGRTPLVGWLKTFMIPEVFGVSIVDSYYEDRPGDYVNYLEFVAQFDKQYSSKRNRRKGTDDSDMNSSVDLIDVELNE